MQSPAPSHVTRSFLLGTLLALAPPFLAQEAVPLLLQGDSIPDLGPVASVDRFVVTDSGEWLLWARAQIADTTRDEALIRNGDPVLVEGDPVVEPAGSVLDFISSLNGNNAGHGGWIMILDDGHDAGVYFDEGLLIRKGDVSTASGFGSGTTYLGFFNTVITDANQILLVAAVDDPNVPDDFEPTLLRLDVDAGGGLAGETVLLVEGHVFPNGAGTLRRFGQGHGQSAMNDSGAWIARVELIGSIFDDEGVCLDGQLIAREGSPSPFTGRNWVTMDEQVDINDAGDYIYGGSVQAGPGSRRSVLVKNATLFQFEGKTLTDPAVAGFTIVEFGAGPLDLTESGQVLWFATFSDPNTDTNAGLFLDDELLVREGDTTVGGLVIEHLIAAPQNYAISDNGRFVMFRALLTDGRDGAFMIDRQGPTTYCKAVPNSTGGPGVIGWTGTPSLAADDLVLTASNLPRDVGGLFFYGPEAVDLPLGNGRVCVGGGDLGFVLRLLPSASSGPGGFLSHALDFDAPPNPLGTILPASTWYFQCWYRDPTVPPAMFNFTDGIEFYFLP